MKITFSVISFSVLWLMYAFNMHPEQPSQKHGIESDESAYTIECKTLCWGYINKNGEPAIPLSFSSAGPFSQGLAVAGIFSEKNGYFGYINKSGQFVIDPRYAAAMPFSEGRAAVARLDPELNRSVIIFEYINKKGATVLEGDYYFAGMFHDDMAPVMISPSLMNPKWACIDRDGNMLHSFSSCRFTYASKGIIRADNGFYNADGKLVFPAKKKIAGSRNISATDNFECISPHNDIRFENIIKSGLVPVIDYSVNKCGYADLEGNVAIDLKFDRVSPFSEGLAQVRTLDKVGYINKSGEMVIKPKFDFGSYFSEGLAVIGYKTSDKQIRKYGFINKQGKCVIKPDFEAAMDFQNGFAAVKQSGKWGFIDTKGNFIAEPCYDKVMPFSEGLAAVAISM